MVNPQVTSRCGTVGFDPVRAETPIAISVLVPLEDHRNSAERCVRAWCTEQTLDRDRYEVILVASKGFPAAQMARIRRLLGTGDRVVTASARHDVEQLGVGARVARGELLMFSESHVWPSPDVLERCVARMAERPEWAGMVCGLKRVTINRLGDAEADMYERDFQSGLKSLRWRNINDAAFCTRRACYDAAGGLDVGLGHFAEWVLAARYATEGLAVGQCPDIDLWHLYTGHLAGLRYFTEDFVRGEIAYLARGRALRRESLIEAPREWSCRGDRRRDLAGHVVRLVAGETVRARKERREARVDWRVGLGWLPTMIAGGAALRAAAALRVLVCRAALFAADRFEKGRGLARAFEHYIAAVIRAARLRRSDEVLARRCAAQTGEVWSALPEGGDAGAGFHDCERFGDVAFRWSHPVAVIGLDLPPGKYVVHVHTLSVQLADGPASAPEFYVNGKLVTELTVWNDGNSIRFPAEVLSAKRNWFGWICPPPTAPEDSRLLGLPLVSVLATVGDP